jgi:hypothetical protein
MSPDDALEETADLHLSTGVGGERVLPALPAELVDAAIEKPDEGESQ